MSDKREQQSGEGVETLLPLWVRFSTGDELSPNEETLLRHALRTNVPFRKLVNADFEVDALLRVQQIERTAESFLQQVMARCTPPSPTGSVSSASSTEEALNVAGPGFSEESLPTFPEYQLVAEREVRASRGKPGRRKHQRSSGLSIIVTVSGVLCAIVAFVAVGRMWWLNSESTPVPMAGGTGVESETGSEIVNGPEIGAGKDRDDQPSETNGGVLSAETRMFATISRLEDAEFRTDRKVGDQVADEELNLVRGTMELTFPTGATVQVFAPARVSVESIGEIRLTSGELSADVPSPAVGFRVTTPTSVIVDLGTVFDVAVESDGTTLVEVRQGHISAVPVDEPELQQWQLMADDMNEVTFYPRLVSAEKGPVASAARGFGGQFSGVISLNDSTLKFTSDREFERIRLELQTLFQTSPEQAADYWKRLVGAEL